MSLRRTPLSAMSVHKSTNFVLSYPNIRLSVAGSKSVIFSSFESAFLAKSISSDHCSSALFPWFLQKPHAPVHRSHKNVGRRACFKHRKVCVDFFYIRSFRTDVQKCGLRQRRQRLVQTVDDYIRPKRARAVFKLFAKPEMRSVRFVHKQRRAVRTTYLAYAFHVAYHSFIGGACDDDESDVGVFLKRAIDALRCDRAVKTVLSK